VARAVQIAAFSIPLLLAACATAPGPRPQLGIGTGTDSSTPATSPLAGPDLRTLIVQGARAMLGQPYRYGGAAPGGFDCSGLVVYAAAGTGIHVPRTAAEQLHTGAPVSRRDVQAGDLVFMHLARKELHVGIAVDNDRFIHAPATGGHVRIDSLNASAYARGYLTARRIVADGTPRSAATVQ
jgi:cell wall-associated NlpC family hydrolase